MQSTHYTYSPFSNGLCYLVAVYLARQVVRFASNLFSHFVDSSLGIVSRRFGAFKKFSERFQEATQTLRPWRFNGRFLKRFKAFQSISVRFEQFQSVSEGFRVFAGGCTGCRISSIGISEAF